MIRSTYQIQNSNVWQKAGQQATSQSSPNTDKRSIIVLGQQKSGKSSFIKIIKGDYDLQTKPTRLIDFYSTKKQGVQIDFYEIGSEKFEELIEFYIKPETCSYLTIVLCVDLTNATDLVNRVNKKIIQLRQMLKAIIEKKKISSSVKQYNQQRGKQYQYIQKNDDIEVINRFPFHFAIVGSKYDLFQKLKGQQKKWISRCLRYLAHVNEANLFYSSTKNMQVCAQLRNIFIDQILGKRNTGLSNQKDHNKPVFIFTGQDKISQMNLPSFNNSGAFNQLKILQQQLQSIFPQKKQVQNTRQPISTIKSNAINLDSFLAKGKKVHYRLNIRKSSV